MDRLRELGYPVHAVMGPVGGTVSERAGTAAAAAGDDKAVAVRWACRTTRQATVTGIEEASLRALAKLKQVLPARLRYRVDALDGAVLAMPPRYDPGPGVDAGSLTAISAAIRAAETLRFDYRSHAAKRPGAGSSRTASRTGAASGTRRLGHRPGRLAHFPGRPDVAADARRPDVRPPPVPRGDVAAYLRRTMGFAMWPHRCVIRVRVPAEDLAGRVEGIVTPIDEHACRLELGSDSYALVALVIGMLDVEFEVESPLELAAHLQVLAGRFARAAGQG